MTTNKAVSLGKSLKKDKKHLIKHVKKDKKTKRRRRRRTNRINKDSNLSEIYTYESPVTNNAVSMGKSNLPINNVNVVYGLKDFLAIKK